VPEGHGQRFLIAWLTLTLMAPGVAAGSPRQQEAPDPSASEVADKQSDLRSLRSQIDTLRREMSAAEGSRREARDQLQDAERVISSTQRELHDLTTQIGTLQSRLKELDVQSQALEQGLKAQQARLEKLLYRQYLRGNPGPLRLFLNGDDPNQLARDLHYLEAIGRARSRILHEIESGLRDKLTLATDARQQSEKLSAIEARQREQHARLLAQRQQRQAMLDQVSEQISTQRREIGNLQRDEKRLAELVGRLSKLIAGKAAEARQRESTQPVPPAPPARASRPASETGPGKDTPTAQARPDDSPAPPAASAVSLATLKGRLRLPTRGAISNRFGTARQEGSTWKGPVHPRQHRQRRAQHRRRARGFRRMDARFRQSADRRPRRELPVDLCQQRFAAETGRRRGPRGGETIATVGNSGGNPESGLYFEIRHQGKPLDPLAWVNPNEVRTGVRQMGKLKQAGLVCAGLLGGVLISLQFSAIADKETRTSLPIEELRTFAEVFNAIKKGYVEPVDDKKLITHAISGMLSNLDPHSSYLDADAFKDLQVGTQGEFGGIGIEVGMEDGLVKVVSPIEDTPAYRAGVKPGDLIFKIDDTLVKGLTLTEAVKRMRGKPKSQIRLSILRKGEAKPIDHHADARSHQGAERQVEAVEDGYGYLRITSFQENTGAAVVKHLNDLFQTGPLKGLVLDLRNDPGGLLNSAVGVSAAFLPPDTLVTSTDGRAPDAKHRFRLARRLSARQPGRLHQPAGRGAHGADGRAGQWRLGFGVRNRRRRAAGPQARRRPRHDDLRQGLGADRVAAARKHRDQADDGTLLHAVGSFDPGQGHRSRHRRRGKRQRQFDRAPARSQPRTSPRQQQGCHARRSQGSQAAKPSSKAPLPAKPKATKGGRFDESPNPEPRTGFEKGLPAESGAESSQGHADHAQEHSPEVSPGGNP
jgi:septal ring factor EnvC (AmiA/AmiB activator)